VTRRRLRRLAWLAGALLADLAAGLAVGFYLGAADTETLEAELERRALIEDGAFG
jgi:recombinational DNA repair protein RecR